MYGAGIFGKKDLDLIATGTNMWNKSPLIHGEADLFLLTELLSLISVILFACRRDRLHPRVL